MKKEYEHWVALSYANKDEEKTYLYLVLPVNISKAA